MLLLSKVATQLAYPLSLGLALMAVAWVLAGRWRRLGWGLLVLGWLMIAVASLPLTSYALMRSLEKHFPPMPMAEVPRADVIVVLGGALGAAIPPRQEVDFRDATDRVWYAAQLYRAGKAPWVLYSGGALSGRASEGEAEGGARLLAAWGVPEDAVLRESKSRTTRENALQTRRLLAQRGWNKVLLVTSAWHMPRALAVFRAVGIDAIPAPTDFRAVARSGWTPLDWLPDAGALLWTTQAIKEYLGFVVYWMRGWV